MTIGQPQGQKETGTDAPMPKRDILRRIQRFNRGREPERLAIKYARMRSNAFVFLRGTAHLFYEDWPRQSQLNAAPKSWICGDLHLENFGGYLAGDGGEYFDVSDFDEAGRAPVTWELARLCVSLLLAASAIGMKESECEALIGRCLDGYAKALAEKRLAPIDAKTAQPDLRQFLQGLSSNHQDSLLKSRTSGKGTARRLRILKNKALPARPSQIKRVKRWWKRSRRNPDIRRFGKLLDVARRVTGTGSLGLQRYALLVATENETRLLELKEAVPAAMILFHRAPANPWRNEADRVTVIQRRAQAAPPRLLDAVEFDRKSFILRELHPGDDKLTVARGKAQRQRLARLAPWLGRTAAASHRRTAGWKGASSRAELAAFAKGLDWREQVAAYAREYKKIVETDWEAFKKATARHRRR
jgi:uncharacterized protein (DUF2252 family)